MFVRNIVSMNGFWHSVMSFLRKLYLPYLVTTVSNALLYRHVAGDAARVRFRLISEDWRVVERELYQVFYETFGASPPCNRMSP